MKLRKLIYLLLCAVISFTAFDATETYAAQKKSKARTSQSSGKSKSRNTKKSGSASRSKKSKSRGNSSKYKTTYKAPPKEQPMNDSLTLLVNHRLIEGIPAHLNPGGLRVNSVKPDHAHKVASIGLNENFTYMPVTRKLIDSLSNAVRSYLPDSISDYRITLNVGTRSLA